MGEGSGANLIPASTSCSIRSVNPIMWQGETGEKVDGESDGSSKASGSVRGLEECWTGESGG